MGRRCCCKPCCIKCNLTYNGCAPCIIRVTLDGVERTDCHCQHCSRLNGLSIDVVGVASGSPLFCSWSGNFCSKMTHMPCGFPLGRSNVPLGLGIRLFKDANGYYLEAALDRMLCPVWRLDLGPEPPDPEQWLGKQFTYWKIRNCGVAADEDVYVPRWASLTCEWKNSTITIDDLVWDSSVPAIFGPPCEGMSETSGCGYFKLKGELPGLDRRWAYEAPQVISVQLPSGWYDHCPATHPDFIAAFDGVEVALNYRGAASTSDPRKNGTGCFWSYEFPDMSVPCPAIPDGAILLRRNVQLQVGGITNPFGGGAIRAPNPDPGNTIAIGIMVSTAGRPIANPTSPLGPFSFFIWDGWARLDPLCKKIDLDDIVGMEAFYEEHSWATAVHGGIVIDRMFPDLRLGNEFFGNPDCANSNCGAIRFNLPINPPPQPLVSGPSCFITGYVR